MQRQSMSDLKNSGKNIDSFLSKKLQDAESKVSHYSDLLREKDHINQALESEILRKEETLRDLLSKSETNSQKDQNNLNKELKNQRKEYRAQIDQLNDQFELKRQECRKLVDELNHKDKLLRENNRQYESSSYDKRDDPERLKREIMILQDEANKYKMQLGQVYREVESYKSSLNSYEQQ